MERRNGMLTGLQLVRLQLRNRPVHLFTSFYDVMASSKSTIWEMIWGRAWIGHLQWMARDLFSV
jgi:hypothetical protein